MEQEILVNYEIISPEEEKNKKGKLDFYYTEESTFGDLKKELGLTNLVIISKSPSGKEVFNYDTFDYIFGSDKVYWNIPILETRIVDYLFTFGCFELFVQQVEGVGAFPFETLEYVLENIGDVILFLWGTLGIIGNLQTAKELVNYCRNYIKKENDTNDNLVASNSFFYSILCREDWNILDFSKKYDMEKEQSEALLRVLGYIYDKEKKCYHITKNKKNQILDDIERISKNNLKKILGIEMDD